MSFAGIVPGHFALVIGVGNYSNMRPLEFACADAIAMEETFRNCGYQTVLATDMAAAGAPSTHTPYRFGSKKADIILAVNLLTQLTTPGSIVVVSFAGHGISHDGFEYIVPSDGIILTVESGCGALVGG